MILILTQPGDPHADIVAGALERKGAPHFRFHPGDFPQRATVTLGDKGTIRVEGRTVDLDEIRTVWNRRPAPSEFPEGLGAQDLEFAQAESAQGIRGLWAVLRDRFWVNRREPGLLAENKPYQLDLAREAGFDVPRTLITNDPDEIGPFFERCGGDVVYKPFGQYAREQDGKTCVLYTNRLRKEDLLRVEGLRLAPGIFQEYVPKRIELRVTVIGTRAFAAAIHSQQSERSKDDWRRYDFANVPYEPYALPEAMERLCVDYVRRLGLVFGCIDLIHTPDGRYVFLEINPNGQWYWVERLTGLPLLEHFTEMLIRSTAAPLASTAVRSP